MSTSLSLIPSKKRSAERDSDDDDDASAPKRHDHKDIEVPEFRAALTPFHLRAIWAPVVLFFSPTDGSNMPAAVVDIALGYLGVHDDTDVSKLAILDDAIARYKLETPADEQQTDFDDSYFCPFCGKYLFTDMGGDVPYEECTGCLGFFCTDCMGKLPGYTEWSVRWKASDDYDGILKSRHFTWSRDQSQWKPK